MMETNTRQNIKNSYNVYIRSLNEIQKTIDNAADGSVFDYISK